MKAYVEVFIRSGTSNDYPQHTFTWSNKHHENTILTPLKLHFYIVKLGLTGVYIIFLISAQKHRLWVLAVLTSTDNECFEQKYEK